MAPRAGLSGASNVNGLDSQTDARAASEDKRLSRTLANPRKRSVAKGEQHRTSGEVRQLSVYHGRTCLGRIVELDERSEAFTADGAPLGVFASTKAAADAISAAHRGGQ